MKIAFGTDHAGFRLKEAILKFLQEQGHQVQEFGSKDETRMDYPDPAREVALAVSGGKVERGVLACGTGMGMCMVANKVRGVRAALAWHPEIARLSRQHNDANVLCLPARFLGTEQALEIVDVWLDAAFEGGRHGRRVDKIMRTEREE